jgi:hypothetical protein
VFVLQGTEQLTLHGENTSICWIQMTRLQKPASKNSATLSRQPTIRWFARMASFSMQSAANGIYQHRRSGIRITGETPYTILPYIQKKAEKNTAAIMKV